MTDTQDSESELSKNLDKMLYDFAMEDNREFYGDEYALLKQRLTSLITKQTEQARQEHKHQLVLFGAEFAYCLANGFRVGEGHTPPSMIYEQMETTVEKWLARERQPSATTQGQKDKP